MRCSPAGAASETQAEQALELLRPLLAGNPGEADPYRIQTRGAVIQLQARESFAQTNAPLVTFKLDGEGAKRFGVLTSENIGRQLAIVLDERVITAPVIRGAIGGSGEISGDFTSAQASDLALLRRAGALPAPLDVIEERTVGPDLGSDSIAIGVSTGIHEQGFANAAIQEFGKDGSYLVRLPMDKNEQAIGDEQMQQLKSAVLATSPEASFERVEIVGPEVSGNFSEVTALALMAAGAVSTAR